MRVGAVMASLAKSCVPIMPRASPSKHTALTPVRPERSAAGAKSKGNGVSTSLATRATLNANGYCSQIPGHANAHARAARVRRRGNPVRRAHLVRRAAPGTAADHMLGAAGVHPRAAVDRRARVVVVPAIGDPLRHVAVHVDQAEGVGRKLTDRRRPPVAVVVTAERLGPAAPELGRSIAIAGEVVEHAWRIAIAPRIARARSGPQRILEFGFAGQAVTLAGARGKPLRVSHGVVP